MPAFEDALRELSERVEARAPCPRRGFSDNSPHGVTFSPPNSRWGGRVRRSVHPWVRRVVVALVVGGAPSAFYPSIAWADEQGQQAAALQQFEDGRKAYEAGQFEQALVAFQGSSQLLPSPNTLLYIARCYRALGQTASAYTNFKMASRVAQDRLQASGEQRYKATRDTAASEAAEIEGRVPWLTLVVPSDLPSDFSLTLDGRPVPTSVWGTAVPTDPGKHVVTAAGHRLESLKNDFLLEDGENKRIEVKLARLPTATLSLSFVNKPAGIAVQVDGKAIGPEELDARREMDVGKHVVVVSAPGYLPFKWEGELTDGEKQTVKIALTIDQSAASGGGTSPWLFYTAAGASVLALGAGGWLAYRANTDATEQKAMDPLERDPAVRDNVRSTSSTANLLFIGGGVLAAGAGVLYFTTDWKGEAEAPMPAVEASVSPWVDGNVAGVNATGRFW